LAAGSGWVKAIFDVAALVRLAWVATRRILLRLTLENFPSLRLGKQ
jgi:hypothetical protein